MAAIQQGEEGVPGRQRLAVRQQRPHAQPDKVVERHRPWYSWHSCLCYCDVITRKAQTPMCAVAVFNSQIKKFFLLHTPL